MAPQQDDIRVEQADDSNKNPVVVVNGKEVVVSSATEKPNRSLWVAWLYIFDVRYVTDLKVLISNVFCSGIQVTIRRRRRGWCESLTASYLLSAVSASISSGSIRMHSTAPIGPA